MSDNEDVEIEGNDVEEVEEDVYEIVEADEGEEEQEEEEEEVEVAPVASIDSCANDTELTGLLFHVFVVSLYVGCFIMPCDVPLISFAFFFFFF